MFVRNITKLLIEIFGTKITLFGYYNNNDNDNNNNNNNNNSFQTIVHMDKKNSTIHINK